MAENYSHFLPKDNPMIYYLLPSKIKRRCKALKRISLEHEQIETKYRLMRTRICLKYMDKSSLAPPSPQDDDAQSLGEVPFNSPPSNTSSFKIIARKAEDLKNMVLEQLANDTETLSGDLKNLANGSSKIREVLNNCESKCHELMTHLANIDWELNEFEDTTSKYHAEMEQAMTQYNMELSCLYKRRVAIVKGAHEPDDYEDKYDDLVDLQTAHRPAYLSSQECRMEEIYSVKFSRHVERMLNTRLKGVPEFWLQSLVIGLGQVGVIQPADRGPLSYLYDVRYYYDTWRDATWHDAAELRLVDGAIDEEEDLPRITLNTDHRTQLLLFFFDKNPHFSNRILSKTLHIDKGRRTGCEMFDGVWVSKREGCAINWFQGKDLTRSCVTPSIEKAGRRQVDTSDSDSSKDGEYLKEENYVAPGKRAKRPPRASFFNFFSDEGLDFNGTIVRRRRPTDGSEINIGLDYDVFTRLREFIVPHAIIAYSRGNLFGFESEQRNGPSVTQKLYYLDNLFTASSLNNENNSSTDEEEEDDNNNNNEN